MDDFRHEDGRHGVTQSRVSYRLPIAIEGDDANGKPFSESTVALNVTRRGAFIVTNVELAPGALFALHSSEDDRVLLGYGQVVWTRTEPEDLRGAGIKLAGDNARWMDYLVAHSVQDLDES